MKIAFLIYDYSPSRGGQERYLERLLRELSAGGHELHVFASACGPGAERGIAFHRVPVPAGAGPSARAILFIRRARRMLAGGRWDIVSGLVRFYPLDVYRMGGGVHRAWLRAKADGAGARLASYARPFTWLALRLEKRIFDPRNCRRIVANSRLCRDQLLALYPYPPERVEVIRNGVDIEQFHPRLRAEHRERVRAALGIPPGAPVALFASHNLRRKGLETALRAAAREESGRPHLIVAGRGRPAPFAALAGAAGAEGRVRFVGHAPDMRPYYGAADYLVLPTRYDPFANVCLESMACGLPVLTTRMNGAAEIVTEGADGFVVSDPADAAAFARAMGALAPGEARARMSAAARAAALPHTAAENARATLDLYRRVAEERDGRPL